MPPLQFGRFRFDPETLELWEASTRAALTFQSAQVLKLLLERRGSLVTRHEIRDAIWRGRVIEFEQGINACICEIRRALGDDAAAPHWIETLPRRGYRFMAGVRAPARMRKAWLIAAGISGVAAVLVAVALLERRAPAEASARVPVEALEAFQAASLLAKQGEAEPARIVDFLERALRIAPDYADAWAALAQARIRSDAPYRQAAHEAHAAIRRALEIDPRHAAATAALAEAQFLLDWDWPAADASYRRALRLDADRHESYLGHAALLFAIGRRDEAFRQLERARRLDPLSTTLHADLSWYLLVDGRPEEALAQCRRLGEIDPNGHSSIGCPYRIFLEKGDQAAAAAVAAEIMQQFGAGAEWTRRFEREDPIRVYNQWRLSWHDERRLAGGSVSHLRMAQILADLGRRDAALEHIAAAIEARERMLPFLPLFPQFRSLEADEEFRELIARIGLPLPDIAARSADPPEHGELD